MDVATYYVDIIQNKELFMEALMLLVLAHNHLGARALLRFGIRWYTNTCDTSVS